MRSKPDVTSLNSTLPSGLYLVATPIGNLMDLSLRAIKVLKSVDVIACEDTRVTGKLLVKHNIETNMRAYHEYNASRMRPTLLRKIEKGGSVALVSDAGTPTISDPGYKLVKKSIECGYEVTATPGANAAITALTISGLPTNRFLFAGFLNPKTKQRSKELKDLAKIKATLIFYESANRLNVTLIDMVNQLGDRPAVIARELTKRYEEVRRDKLSKLCQHYRVSGAPKGEIVILVGPPITSPLISDSKIEALLSKELQTLSVRDATIKIALETGAPKRKVYTQALKLSKKTL